MNEFQPITSLPDSKLSVNQVNALTQLAKIQAARPQFVQTEIESDQSVIGILFILNTGKVAIIGYDESEDNWKRLLLEDINNESAIDEQLDTVFNWFIEKYGEEGYATVGTV